MSYFNYKVNNHLYRPTSIIKNTTYPGNDAQNMDPISLVNPVSPFDSQTIHNNLFYLGAGLMDTTERVSLLENLHQTASLAEKGYLFYNGKEEKEGALYGGKELVFTGNVNVSSFTFDTGVNKRGFRLSVGDAIVKSSGAVDTANTRYFTFVFTSGGTGTAMNSVLKGNSHDLS